MTISSETRKAGPFSGNDVTTNFPFAFKVFTTSDVLVVKTSAAGVESLLLLLNTDYSVALNADQDVSPGGSVTYPLSGAPLAGGATPEKLTLTSTVLQTQGTSLPSGGAWFPKTIERALDRLTILIQQVYQSITRTLTYPISDTAVSGTLPTVLVRANKFLGFDANGAPIAASSPSGGTVSAAMAPVVSAATLQVPETLLQHQRTVGANYSTRTLQARNNDLPSVLDWSGMDPTGAADSTTAWANLIAADPGVVIVPPGSVFKINATLTFNRAITVMGWSNNGLKYQPAQAAGFKFLWAGGASPMAIWGTNGGADVMAGGGINGAMFDAAGVATECLQVKDASHFEMRALTLSGAITRALHLTSTAAIASGNPSGLGKWFGLNIQLRNLAAAINADGIYVNGQHGAGATGYTLDDFHSARIDHQNGAAIKVHDFGDGFKWYGLHTFRANGDTGPGVWFDSTNAAAVCNVHNFYYPIVSGGFRFDKAGIHFGTRIQGMDTRNLNSGVLPIFNIGSAEIDATDEEGRVFGPRRYISPRETMHHDSMNLVRFDFGNLTAHTSCGNWKATASIAGNVTAGGQQGAAVNIQTNNVLNDVVAIQAFSLGGDGVTFSAGHFPNLAFTVAPISTANVKHRFGFMDAIADPANNGAWVEYVPGTSANWRCVTSSGGAQTVVDTGVAVAVAKISWRIEVIEGSGINFWYRANGSEQWVFATTINTNIAAVMSPVFYVKTLAAAFANALICDYKLAFKGE